ncbi:MAG: YdcF family protein [Chelatococcus sp.]|uniref:YdcF family protein n=1 Tax=Chelatococcus sp. TaxID=1953771 RepID=UPI0025C4CA93|nr:YdcF family protein [Chelatococcus sp.]MBX3536700.1 YdcF family protein [Chelatococcus sp.]
MTDGLAITNKRQPLKIGRRLKLVGIGAFVIALVLLIGGFFAFVRQLDSYRTSDSTTADGIVVLTGGAQRIAEASDLLARGRAKRMLITGVNLKTTREQIVAVNSELAHLVDCCVDLDYRARNTIGNAIGARRWAQENNFESVIVVTSNYHMPRTLVELGNTLPGVKLMPYAVVAENSQTERWWSDAATTRLLVMEYVKFLAASVRTLVEGDPEHSRMAVLVGGREPAISGPLMTKHD